MGTYLVTGANRGIGLAFARRLLARGDAVIGTARQPEKASELADLGAEVKPLDAGDEDSVRSLAANLAGRSLDVLINNAGVFPDRGKGLDALDAAALLDCYRVNALGPLLVLRHLAPNLEDGSRRMCVNIGSQMGSITRAVEGGRGGDYAYSSSKSALNMNSIIAANDYRPRGISVVVLHPGWVQTGMGGDEAPLQPEDSVARMLPVIDALTPNRSGAFLDLDGNDIPW